MLYEETRVDVSYKKLWKLLADHDMMKKDLQNAVGISWVTVTKNIYDINI